MQTHTSLHSLSFSLLSLSAVVLFECRARATLVRSPLSRASCHVLFSVCVCVPYVSAHYYYYFYLYFTFCCCCCRCCKHVKYFLFVCRRLSTLNPQIVYVFRCVCVRVFVCARGQFMLWSRTPPFPHPLCHCNCCAQQTQTLAVPVMRRLLPPPVACASSAASSPPTPLRLSSFTFLFFAQLKCLSNYLDVFPPASCVNWLTLSSQKRKGETKNDLIYR